MPVFLLMIGIIFLVAAIRGNQKDLLSLIREDFSGQNNFFLWVLAIVIIVAMGNFKAIKPISDAFLGLVILVIVVATYKNGKDIFSSFMTQLRNGTS